MLKKDADYRMQIYFYASKNIFIVTKVNKFPSLLQGASQGQYIQSEVVATGVAVLVWYLAYNARCNLQS